MVNKKNILNKLAEEIDKIGKIYSHKTSAKKKDESKAKDNKQKTASNSSMENLLEENYTEIPMPGDTLQGKIISISSNSILADFSPFGIGIILGKETRDGMRPFSKIKKGDQITAVVLETENEDGIMELSIRQASYEKIWQDIKEKMTKEEIISVKILGANKGGLITEVNGISCFLPVSQLSSKNYPRVEDGNKNKILEILKKLIGTELKVRILDADKETEKLIVSEKSVFNETEKEAIAELKIGDIIEGRISGIVDFGAFVKFLPPSKKNSGSLEDELEGLVHISEMAWQLIDDPRKIVKVGDRVNAKIIGIEDNRISLSLRALERDPWDNIAQKYEIEKIYPGIVNKINHFGAFVYLDKDIHGLAHISEFNEVYPGEKMDKVLKVGETYNWKILSIEPKEHRMSLMIVKKEEKKPETEKAEKKTKKEKKEKVTKEENKEKKSTKKKETVKTKTAEEKKEK